jgi:hypothetical protein
MDTLATVFSFCSVRDHFALARVSRAFNDCIFSVAHAWSTTISVQSGDLVLEQRLRASPGEARLRTAWRAVRALEWMDPTNSDLMRLPRICPELTSLAVRNTPAEYVAPQDDPPALDLGIRAVVAGCVRLERLNLGVRVESDATMQAIVAGCPQLCELEVAGSILSDQLLAALARSCPRLHSFRTGFGSRLTNAGVLALTADRPALQCLGIDGAHLVSDAGLAGLTRCPELRDLAVNSCAISDECLASIAAACPKLQRLSVVRCQGISSVGFAALASLSLLTSVSIGGVGVSDESLTVLAAACPNLTHMIIVDTNGSLTTLCPLAAHCPRLQLLSLISCSVINAGCIAELSAGCPGLRSLYITGQVGLEQPWSPMPNLRTIGAGKCALTDAHVATIVRTSPRLLELSLDSPFQVAREDQKDPTLTDAAAEAIAAHGRCLKMLRLPENCAISSAGVFAIARGCQRLEELDVSGCDGLTDASLVALAAFAPALKELRLPFRAGTRVTELARTVFRAARPRVVLI